MLRRAQAIDACLADSMVQLQHSGRSFTYAPMHILMLVPHYEPDLGPSAPLFTLLGVELAKRGHRVTVITTVPHYPSGSVDPEFRGWKLRRSVEQGIRVLRVPLPSVRRSNLLLRMLQFVCYQLGAVRAGRDCEFDVALVANPGLWVWFPFARLIRRRRKPAIFSVFDLFPDVGVALGIFRHQIVTASVARLERYCLRHSAAVSILSDSFRPGLRALGVPDNKMSLISGWVDTELVRPMARDNSFSEENRLRDAFVVMYAGNIGRSQGLGTVLWAAGILSREAGIRFVMVGDGAGRESLMRTAAEQRLPNVAFLPFQPRRRLPEVLATADVALVVLRRGIAAGSLPSKIFSILASGRPILAAVDQGSDAWNLITNSEAGICIPPENPSELARAVLALRGDPELCRRLGENGRRWAEHHHSPQAAASQFEHLLSIAITSPCPNER